MTTEIPSWTRVLPTLHEDLHVETLTTNASNGPGGLLYVGHYKDKAIATYEVDELYAFFLDNGVPPEFTIYDELDLPLHPMSRL